MELDSSGVLDLSRAGTGRSSIAGDRVDSRGSGGLEKNPKEMVVSKLPVFKKEIIKRYRKHSGQLSIIMLLSGISCEDKTWV